MTLKFKLKLIIFLTFSANILSFSEEDTQKLYNDYFAKSVNYHEEIQGLTNRFFVEWAKTSMIQRVENYRGIIGAGTGGFAFLADYMPPDGDSWIPVVVKMLPEIDEDFDSFFSNLIQAELTGDLAEDKFTPSIQAPYSLDRSDKRAVINTSSMKNRHKKGICKFYEMQSAEIQYERILDQQIETFYITTLITEAGVSDMVKPLFSNALDMEGNTATLLRYFVEIAEAAMNVNKQGILHGDIKPDNMILVMGKDGLLHVEYIDFDLILNPKYEKWTNTQLRYTSDYRAPWIVEKETVIKVDDGYKVKVFYTFDPEFREDTFAVAMSILELMITNKKQIFSRDPTFLAIYNYIKLNISQKSALGAKAIPTTEQFYQFIKEQVDQREPYQMSQQLQIDSNPLDSRVRNAPLRMQEFSTENPYVQKKMGAQQISRPQMGSPVDFKQIQMNQKMGNLNAFKEEYKNVQFSPMMKVFRVQADNQVIHRTKSTMMKAKNQSKNVDFQERNRLELTKLQMKVQSKLKCKCLFGGGERECEPNWKPKRATSIKANDI